MTATELGASGQRVVDAYVKGRIRQAAAEEYLSDLSRHPAHTDRSLRRLAAQLDQVSNGASARALRRGLARSHLRTGASRVARGKRFAAASNSVAASRAAREVVADGGNAVDAAIATMATLWVTDPANVSPLGRSQWIIGSDDGRPPLVLNGATRGLAGTGEPADGWQAAPLPGNLELIAELVERGLTSKPLEELMAPAIRLAEEGYTVTSTYGEIWARSAAALARDRGTRRAYLKPDGSPYRAGERFQNPGLARFLRRIARSGESGVDGIREFHRGEHGRRFVHLLRRRGSRWTPAELARQRAHVGRALTAELNGYRVVTSGERETWGHALAAMVNLANELARRGVLSPGRGDLTPREVEALLLIEMVALEQNPYEVGTLAPKPRGASLAELTSKRWSRKQATRIIRLLDGPPQKLTAVLKRAGLAPANQKKRRAVSRPGEDRDTTSATVVANGSWVQFITSVGPWFGAKRAIDGVLLAHSYAMENGRVRGRARPRDRTEQAPTLVYRHNGKTKQWEPALAIGAAGSERIVGSIFYTLAVKLLLRPERDVAEAVTTARVFPKAGAVRTHLGMPKAVLDHLKARGYPVALTGRGVRDHIGIVSLVAGLDGDLVGVADSSSQGAATAE